jgi:single-stranded DNA-binding protein
LWGTRGEKLAQYLLKGQSVLVYGEMDLNVYQAKDGSTKASFKCRVTDVELIGKKDSEKSEESPSYAHQAPANGKPDFEDDIPF